MTTPLHIYLDNLPQSQRLRAPAVGSITGWEAMPARAAMACGASITPTSDVLSITPGTVVRAVIGDPDMDDVPADVATCEVLSGLLNWEDADSAVDGWLVLVVDAGESPIMPGTVVMLPAKAVEVPSC